MKKAFFIFTVERRSSNRLASHVCLKLRPVKAGRYWRHWDRSGHHLCGAGIPFGYQAAREPDCNIHTLLGFRIEIDYRRLHALQRDDSLAKTYARIHGNIESRMGLIIDEMWQAGIL